MNKSISDAVGLILLVFSREVRTCDDYCRRVSLIPQMMRLYESIDVNTKPAALKASEYYRLVCCLGTALTAMGKFDESADVLEAGLSTFGASDLDNPALQGGLLNYLSYAYINLGRFDEAKTMLVQALKVNHESSVQRIMSLNRMACVLQANGQYEQALQLLEEAEQNAGQVLNEDDPMLARIYNFKGSVYIDMGVFDKAEKMLSRSLKIKQASYDNFHPSLALTYKMQAKLFEKMQHIKKQTSCIENALKIEQTIYGDEHPYTKASIEMLQKIK